MDLPYRAEYAKSGRASCRGCKSPIDKDSLRLAVLVQSPMFDSKVPNWYHLKCFFKKQRPKSADDIEFLESLRWEDQEKIKKEIESCASIIVPDKKGKKRDAAEALAKKTALKDFVLEYAKSGRAMCRGCEQKILKDEVRISKKDYESDIGKRYGGQDLWHHYTCFAKLRAELGYFESADKLPGFKSLKKEDQTEVLRQIPAIKQENVPDIKKVKSEDVVDGNSDIEKKIKKQNKTIFEYRDQLKESLKKKDLSLLLEYNNQKVPSGEEAILDLVSDIMTFGAFEPCEQCKGGPFVFKNGGYECQGDLTGWAKCVKMIKKPKRRPFKVPSELAEEHPFLKKYKYTPRERIIRDVQPTVKPEIKAKDDPDGDKPKIERQKPALYDMEFVILGHPKQGKDELKNKIAALGGKVVTKIQRSVMAVIASKADVEKMGSRITEAQAEDVHVVSEDFVDEAKDYTGKIPELVLKKNICTWGSNPSLRLPPETSLKSHKSRSRFTSNIPDKIKLKLKGGGAVDPDSGLEDIAHVYEHGGEKYNVVLAKTDIQKQQNSYYKLQLLKSDSGNKFWVFRAWGRIGTTIGSNKLEKMHSLQEARQQFCAVYEEKTGNRWENRKHFVKVPECFCPIDVDYNADEANSKLQITDKPSKLPKPVQDLIRLIFDVNSMNKAMLEFELDTEKMPLGKLSKTQIQKAYKVLSDLQTLLNEKGEQAYFIEASNRFYTLIPHSFGIDEPPIINTEEMIHQKLEMLDSLMEMEIAYNLMKSAGSHHDIDTYYHQLKAEVGVLERDSDEFSIIEEYVKNTHAKTHTSYELEIQEIYTVKRQGEDMRYKPFRKLHNRKLLWHGSRLTNYAGILSQGLRVAPPEAPVTGYMFGKGIYFADMVSKSANYCNTTPVDPTGLLLLCEVALGNMHECRDACYLEKPPKGKHSTKGIGKTYPNPEESKKLGDVEVPLGKPKTEDLKTSLLYNEFIVYDIAQVKIQYLLKVNFKYKY